MFDRKGNYKLIAFNSIPSSTDFTKEVIFGLSSLKHLITKLLIIKTMLI